MLVSLDSVVLFNIQTMKAEQEFLFSSLGPFKYPVTKTIGTTKAFYDINLGNNVMYVSRYNLTSTLMISGTDNPKKPGQLLGFDISTFGSFSSKTLVYTPGAMIIKSPEWSSGFLYWSEMQGSNNAIFAKHNFDDGTSSYINQTVSSQETLVSRLVKLILG